MVCIFSRGMLGVSALVIAAGCASAPSQPPTRGSGTSSSTLNNDLQSRSSGVLIQTTTNGGISVALLTPPNSFGATSFQPAGSTDRNPKPPENVPLETWSADAVRALESPASSPVEVE